MSVDYIPMLLAASILVSLMLSAVLWQYRRARWAFMLVAVSCLVTYGVRYHVEEWRYSGSAGRGKADAAFRLGASLMGYGRGAAHDPVRGLELLSVAAEQGHVRAQMMLAGHYLLGLATPKDTNAAIALYQAAAAQGSDEAKVILALIEQHGVPGAFPTGRVAQAASRWIRP